MAGLRVLLGLGALTAASLVVRTRALGDSLWIDEALSVGIASHGLGELPSLLRQDGSPPLYYALLHVWTGVFGTGEQAVRSLSLLFALAIVPAAFWAGRALFGERAGWASAALAAFVPFLSAAAQEARMYSLVALLSVVATAALLRGSLPVFALALALLLYAHNWGLFFAAGGLAAAAVVRRRAWPAFAAAGLAFVPWLPTLAFQAAHTGAPWSNPPPLVALAAACGLLVLALLLRAPRERALALLAGAALLTAWLAAHVEPMWAARYLAILVGPLLLLAGALLARAGPVGLAALVVLAAVWLDDRVPPRSNVREAAAALAPQLEPGDLVLSTQPEQVPALAYYLPRGLRYATPLGPVADPRVMDWRDALARLEAANIEPPSARRVLVVRPVVGDGRRWRAPWTRLVARRSAEWGALFANDPRRRRVAVAGGGETSRTSVVAELYEDTDVE